MTHAEALIYAQAWHFEYRNYLRAMGPKDAAARAVEHAKHAVETFRSLVAFGPMLDEFKAGPRSPTEW